MFFEKKTGLSTILHVDNPGCVDPASRGQGIKTSKGLKSSRTQGYDCCGENAEAEPQSPSASPTSPVPNSTLPS